MRRATGLAAFAFLALAWTAAEAADEKGKVIEFDGMKAAVPAEWKEEKPANNFRYKQFRLPKVKDDKDDGVMIIFKGLGGSPEKNIERWKGMFIPPEGKKVDDISKVSKIKIGKVEAPYLEVWGTYKDNPAPFDPKSKTVERPGYRMLNIHYEGEDETYHIRLVGPSDTVEQYKKGFEDWLKALKK